MVPVLQKTVDTYKFWQNGYALFPRQLKFSLGMKIDSLFTQVIESLLLARYASQESKLPALRETSAKLDLLKFFLQVAWEMKCLDNKKYGDLSALLNEIGRMVGAWQKDAQKKQPSPDEGRVATTTRR